MTHGFISTYKNENFLRSKFCKSGSIVFPKWIKFHSCALLLLGAAWLCRIQKDEHRTCSLSGNVKLLLYAHACWFLLLLLFISRRSYFKYHTRVHKFTISITFLPSLPAVKLHVLLSFFYFLLLHFIHWRTTVSGLIGVFADMLLVCGQVGHRVWKRQVSFNSHDTVSSDSSRVYSYMPLFSSYMCAAPSPMILNSDNAHPRANALQKQAAHTGSSAAAIPAAQEHSLAHEESAVMQRHHYPPHKQRFERRSMSDVSAATSNDPMVQQYYMPVQYATYEGQPAGNRGGSSKGAKSYERYFYRSSKHDIRSSLWAILQLLIRREMFVHNWIILCFHTLAHLHSNYDEIRSLNPRRNDGDLRYLIHQRSKLPSVSKT